MSKNCSAYPLYESDEGRELLDTDKEKFLDGLWREDRVAAIKVSKKQFISL